MYNFHYHYIKKKYPGGHSRLLFTDTDSLTSAIASEDVYKDFHEDRQMFDNSDYPEDSPFHLNYNKKMIGKTKDEASGCPIMAFVGLTKCTVT